ncbi:MAG: NB-ARC domain-containing protein, partial [Ktedonobacterales bacterium]
MARTTQTAVAPAPPAIPPLTPRGKRPAAIIALLWFMLVTLSAALILSFGLLVFSAIKQRAAPLLSHLWQTGSWVARGGLIGSGIIGASLTVVAALKLYDLYHPDDPEPSTSPYAPPPYIPPPLPIAPPAAVRAPNGLPLARPFVGRREQLDTLKAQLRRGTTTGVTALRGMGGIGKTALAAEAVSELAEETAQVNGAARRTFPGGALWIACENLRGPAGLDELWRRVAVALEVSLANIPDPAGALNAVLQSLPLTLVALDNVEAEQREIGPDGREVVLA